MDIKVVNKDRTGFDVLINWTDDNNTSDFKPVLNHVCDRMDNYYDANGLLDIEWGLIPDEESVTYIQVMWNDEYDLPEDEDIIENVNRWLSEVV